MINAIALVPDGPIDVYLNQCIAHCSHRGYAFVGLVRNWSAALDMLRPGLATVVVFARPEHLDPDREPRVEVCGETTQQLFRQSAVPAAVHNRRGRPHIVN